MEYTDVVDRFALLKITDIRLHLRTYTLTHLQ